MKSRLAALVTATMTLATAVVTAPSPALAADNTPGLPGPHNAITDVPGVQVGQVQSTRAPYLTGTTVVYAPQMAVTGVDQRGGAPATKETDLLNPLNSNPGVNAVMLGGSSMYGLSAADGVIGWLEDRREGINLGAGVAPIVPAADILDLGRGGNFQARTSPAWGYLAAAAANSGPVAQGNVGGGTGARSGGMKGGVGTASVNLANGIVVGAIVVVNSAGSSVDSSDCSLWAARYELDNEFRGLETPRKEECNPPGNSAEAPPMNTTIAVVATNAPLEKAATERMASNAHDGMARAINPIHTLGDGDTVFAMSTGKGTPLRVNNPADGGQLNQIFNAGATTLARAIDHAILEAKSVGNTTSYCDRYPSACKKIKPLPEEERGTAPEVTEASLAEANAKLAKAPPVPAGGNQPAALNPAATAADSPDTTSTPVALHGADTQGGLGWPAVLALGLFLVIALAGGSLIRRRRTTS